MNLVGNIAIFWSLLGSLAAVFFALLLWPGLADSTTRRRTVALWLGLTLGAVGLYSVVGAPGLLLARARWQEGRQAAAREAAEAGDAVKQAESNPVAWRRLGDARMRQGLFPLAVDAYRRETVLSAGDPQAMMRFGRAQVLASGGKVTDEATRAFAMVQKIQPTAQAELFLAMHAADGGQKSQARTMLASLIANPETPPEVLAAAREQLGLLAR